MCDFLKKKIGSKVSLLISLRFVSCLITCRLDPEAAAAGLHACWVLLRGSDVVQPCLSLVVLFVCVF